MGIQETIKQDFYDHELRSLLGGSPFIWDWIPARGHSGGILVGIKDDILEVEGWIKGNYYIEAIIRDRLTNFRWRLIVVYGPANHSFSKDFITELEERVHVFALPVLLGGDFNLIRERSDKSSGQGDTKLMELFNNFIGENDLREIKRCGQKYTWTNKQLNPVLSNIDRVLCSIDWELHFPLCTLKTLTRVGLDHWPLLLEDGSTKQKPMKAFKFER